MDVVVVASCLLLGIYPLGACEDCEVQKYEANWGQLMRFANLTMRPHISSKDHICPSVCASVLASLQKVMSVRRFVRPLVGHMRPCISSKGRLSVGRSVRPCVTHWKKNFLFAPKRLIRALVRPSVRPSFRPSVRWSVGM